MMHNTPRWLLKRGPVTERAITAVAVLAGWLAATAAAAVLHLDVTAVLVAAGAVLVSIATANALLGLRRRERARHVEARFAQLKAEDAALSTLFACTEICGETIKGLEPDADGETPDMTMIMEQRLGRADTDTVGAERSLETDVPQDAVDLNRCHDGLDGGLMSQMSHEAFAERIVTGITNPAQLAGEVCLNCAKPADRDMAPAGWAETGERVYVHRGECYMRLKWWAEAPIRRARREAAPGIVQGLTDEAIRLVLEQVIAAGVRSRRSEMDTDLAHAETAAERARAAELPLPPCPSWCAGASDLDSWGWDGEEFRRIHERTLYKSTPPEDESGLGARLVVLQYERWQDGAPVLEPAMVDVTVETGDPATVRAMTSALNEAATMLEKLAAG
jgi:hypothetical protein